MRIKRLVAAAVMLLLMLGAACSPITKREDQPQVNGEKSVQGNSATSVPALKTADTPQPALQKSTNTPSATQTSQVSSMAAMDAPAGKPAPMLKISDQSLKAGMLTVDEVVSSGPGWVVIYTTKPDGKPDRPIGSAAVTDGDNQNVMVPVDTSLADGTLYAQLHVDRGTQGKFEFPGPDEPAMVGLQMISGTFKVLLVDTAEPTAIANGTKPSIMVANQPIKDGKVILPKVVSAGEAWVVIHKQNGDGTMGPMVGFAKVQNGINKNVTIPVDTSLTSRVMYAMLHENNAKKTSPQFPGVDSPVMVNGQMISPTFEITDPGSADVFINLGSKPENQNYLVDGNDMSLYVSLKDSPGKSNCVDDCLNTWRPLLATGRILPGDGVPAKNLGVLLLANGTRQVTYLGAPLYQYTKDEKPGDMNAQGLDGTWYLVTP